MNKRNIILAVFVVLLLGAGVFAWRSRPVAIPMRLDLIGTPGLKVAGTLVVDGVEREFSGVLPTHVAVEARTFDYTIRMQEARGELHGQLTVGDGVYGSSTTSNDFTGVRGSYHRTWASKGGGFTTTRSGE